MVTSLPTAREDQVARRIPAKRGTIALSKHWVPRASGRLAQARAASIADRAAIVAALQVLCALPDCARGALNAPLDGLQSGLPELRSVLTN
jgi:hypothetical protein